MREKVLKYAVATVCVLMLSLFCTASDAKLDAAGDKSYAILKKASYFATGGVGFANVTSSAELALRILMKQKQAGAALKSLLKEASPAGQMYALIGLKRDNPVFFAKVIPGFLASKTKVATESGCFMVQKTIADVAADIKGGKHDVLPKRK